VAQVARNSGNFFGLAVAPLGNKHARMRARARESSFVPQNSGNGFDDLEAVGKKGKSNYVEEEF